MEGTDQNNELFSALAKAQLEIRPAAFDKKNPIFNSKYATLASVWDACREPLSKNGLAIVQFVLNEGDEVFVSTTLGHSSGQWVASRLRLILLPSKTKDGREMPVSMQTIGSAITYARRYALSAMVGVVSDEDDDGNIGSTPPPRPLPPRQPAPAPRSNPKDATPATVDQRSAIDQLMVARGVTQDQIEYLIYEGYGQSMMSVFPVWIADDLIELLSDEDCTPGRVMATAERLKNETKANQLLNPEKKTVEDHGEYQVTFGTTLKGKKLKEIGEAQLKESLAWVRNKLKETPAMDGAQHLLEFQAKCTAFLKSVGVNI